MTRLPRWEITVGAAILAISVALVFGMSSYGERLEQRRLRDLAVTAAASLEAPYVAALAASPDYAYTDTATFRHLRATLSRIRAGIKDARFTYLIAKRDGQWRFLADAESAASKDYSPPGQVFKDDAAGFETVLATKRAYIEPVSRDQRGVWVSGEAPIADPATGQVIAVLGIDVDAAQWVNRVTVYRWIGAGMALLLIGVTFAFSIGHRKLDRNFRSLERAEMRARRIMDSALVGMVTTDEDGVIDSFNPEAERIFGYTEAEAVGLNVSALMPEEFLDEHGGHVRRYLGTRAGRLLAQRPRELPGRRKDGATIPLEVGIGQMTIGGRTTFICSVQDLSARKAAEEHLRQAQKVETLGKLTGGVAHDFNNLLMAMQLNLELVEERVADDAEAVGGIQAALNAIKRGAELTSRLLSFSRKQPLRPQVTNVNALVSETMMLLERTVEKSIQVETVLAPDVWNIRVDTGQLANALINLVVNAREAMPHGGSVVIETANAALDEDYVRPYGDLPAGDYVLLSVSDTGAGMTPEVLERAFDPFFTTRDVGKGSGLGLSMVFGFVKQSGGHIKLYSQPGHGTTAKLFFPRARAAARQADAPRPAPSIARARGETILLVEDDDEVRTSVKRILTTFGYRVHDSANGPDALRLIDGGLRPDLLLTDIVLPHEMNGPQVSRAVVAKVPTCKTLYMSGYTENAVIRQGRLDDGVVLLSKPFLREPLAAKIREVLDG